jgi:hypothetical protein
MTTYYYRSGIAYDNPGTFSGGIDGCMAAGYATTKDKYISADFVLHIVAYWIWPVR